MAFPEDAGATRRWQTIAEGAGMPDGDVSLSRGHYRLTVSTSPIGLPDWVAGSLQSALAAVGVRNVAVVIADQSVVIEFDV